MNQQHPSSLPSSIKQSSWAFLGQVVRERREFIGFSQEDVAANGGPKKTTVSKIERGAEAGYAIKTQQLLEKSLGWERGAVREILVIAEEGGDNAQAYANDYIEWELPDLTDSVIEGGSARRATDLSDDELLAELTYRIKKYSEQIERFSDVAPAAQKSELSDRRRRREAETSDHDEIVAPAADDVDPHVDEEPGGSDS